MPELPEVETIVCYLRSEIRGKRILNVEVRGRRVLRDYKDPKEFIKLVVSKRIENISRLGKNIIFELSGRTYFALHLMMTGRLFLNPAQRSIHDRLIFQLSGKQKLIFNDIRQFGWCRVVFVPHMLVGPDALSLSLREFKNLIRRRGGVIKNTLLNQKIISGIGNIYSDEILWYARIKPTRKTDSLFGSEIDALYRATEKVLKLAIKKGGTSARDYRKPDGSKGGYYEIRRAYQRTGKRCVRDGAVIRRIIIGQRSAHYCPKHQR